MFYRSLKNFVKKFPFVWKLLKKLKDSLIILSRLKDVSMMMILLTFFPKYTYKFSTRKLLPKKSNKYDKANQRTIPYDLYSEKSSKFNMLEEANVICKGNSFNLNDIKKIKGPIFLSSFWSSLKIDDEGKIHYKSWSDKHKDLASRHELIKSDPDSLKEYRNENITYVLSRLHLIKEIKEKKHNVLCMDISYVDINNKYQSLDKVRDLQEFKKLNCPTISLIEQVYKPPLLKPNLNFAPACSCLQTISAVIKFTKKINIYGWDYYLEKSPNDMSYFELLLKMYIKKKDVLRSRYHFEAALLNFYYAYQLSKLPNINIYGHLENIGKHKKLIKKIERVLFN